MGFSGAQQVTSQDVRTLSSTKLNNLGAVGITRDGRVYRYTRAGATALDPGKITVAATVDSNYTNKAVTTAAAVGTNEVRFTAGGTTTADKYVDGTLNVNDANGEGVSYLVAGHLTTAAQVVQIVEPIAVALTTSSEVTLTQNPWADTVISVADQADFATGIPNVSITAAYYGWTQTRGVCAALADEAITAGKAIVIGDSTVGAVSTLNAAGEAQIGVAIVAGVDTEYREVFLTID